MTQHGRRRPSAARAAHYTAGDASACSILAAAHLYQARVPWCAAGAEAGVLCPVCKSCQLVQRSGLLVCPAEGWRLNLAAESMSLEDIRTRLATAYEVRRGVL